MKSFLTYLTEARYNWVDLLSIAIATQFLVNHQNLTGLGMYLATLVVGSVVSVLLERTAEKCA